MFEPSFSIQASSDFRRIQELPRRTWTKEDAEKLAEGLTKELKRPWGSWKLKPIQAVALWELHETGGLFCPAPVGAGKTLISLLSATVLKAKRTLILLPSALIEKTKTEWRELYNHWLIPRDLRFLSYEFLGRVSGAKALDDFMPDLIVVDEAHRLKNPRAGVTRRVKRYMEANPQTHFVALSGTMLKDDIKDFGNLIRWALKEGAPVPMHERELDMWAEALKDQSPFERKVAEGVLTKLNGSTIENGRTAFKRRLFETPGVVGTLWGGASEVTSSLYIEAHKIDPIPEVDLLYKQLREEWIRPDGWALSDAVDVWRHAQELALGFHYHWNPPPPKEWLLARKMWAQFVRKTLSRSRTLDTEKQVADACEADQLDGSLWRPWKAIKDTFRINQVVTWHDSTALNFAKKWIESDIGIVWVGHTEFGQRLSEMTGFEYYAQDGISASGLNIIDAPKGKSIIASIRANSAGKNLQDRFYRNLVTMVPGNSNTWEQMIGRTHRFGQTADTVQVDVLYSCAEHHECMMRSIANAKMIEQLTGHVQKITLADKILPNDLEIERFSGYRWKKTMEGE